MQNESITLRVSPAGKAFMRFVAAMNSTDEDRAKTFISENFSEDVLLDQGVDVVMRWFNDLKRETGGLDVHKVYLSQEHFIIVITIARTNGAMYMTKLKVTPEKPHKITEYVHEAAPRVV
ncbi:MAG: hypothetical protein OHK0046_35650 [Anaerolineae bacterium]